jgi:hypothetical protein
MMDAFDAWEGRGTVQFFISWRQVDKGIVNAVFLFLRRYVFYCVQVTLRQFTYKFLNPMSARYYYWSVISRYY